MAIAFVVGATLIAIGLVLLSHHSYQNLSDKKNDDDPEALPAMGDGQGKPDRNDCILPFCYFRVERITNHESWIVAFLASGALVLLMGIVPAQEGIGGGAT